jgi:MATE family multidrug resistance protein
MTAVMAVSIIQAATQRGQVRHLLLLFFPIFVTTLSSCLVPFVERLLLARLDIHTVEASITATYAYQVFQVPSMALAMMAQVSVGHWTGAQNLKMIGPCIWQFLWFSVLSTSLIVPLGMLYGSFYFSDSGLKTTTWSYYIFLLSMNFLYPMGTTLSSFYLGQGKTLFILIATLSAQGIQLLLSFLLIFGYGGLPSCGLMGIAWSFLFAQGGFCVILVEKSDGAKRFKKM